jgi:carbon monoxide dehydrogenase subunit G
VIRIDTAGVLPAPPRVVWDLITDWENQGDWMLEATNFEVLSPQRQGVGVEAAATISIAGLIVRDRVRVSAWNPPERLEIRHLGWVTGRGEFQLTSVDGDSTRVVWREELEPPLGILGDVGMSVLKPVMSRIFRRDLRILASLCRVAYESRA